MAKPVEKRVGRVDRRLPAPNLEVSASKRADWSPMYEFRAKASLLVGLRRAGPTGPGVMTVTALRWRKTWGRESGQPPAPLEGRQAAVLPPSREREFDEREAIPVAGGGL